MSTSDNVFVAVDESVGVVAGWLGEVLGLEAVVGAEVGEDERLFRRPARAGDGVVRVVVRRNGFAMVEPEPDEVQAIDRYAVDLDVSLVGLKDEAWQLRETEAIFGDLVAARPDVPALLVHNLDTLMKAHLPGAGTHTFDPLITPDAEDLDTWRGWVVGG
ncbi:hypothetical protein GCM10009804_10350 [Kribbella hippodromi]|uniref:Uncharacterized protein n=1 Tax=Kribbella hippodromi TaxID=434347 RepID=A0ABN2CAA9_9ACTN